MELIGLVLESGELSRPARTGPEKGGVRLHKSPRPLAVATLYGLDTNKNF
jgi:hypothetical protein